MPAIVGRAGAEDKAAHFDASLETAAAPALDAAAARVAGRVKRENVKVMASRRRTAGKSGKVTPFPPLPGFPKAPWFPVDARQSSSSHIVGAITGVAGSSMRVSGPNLTTGFHASAVDVGRLQNALERGLGRFDESQLAARWDEIFTWIRQVIRWWVQRCKRMRIERRETGIRIELETQDDFGYYEYGFDVFPRRGTKPK